MLSKSLALKYFKAFKGLPFNTSLKSKFTSLMIIFKLIIKQSKCQVNVQRKETYRGKKNKINTDYDVPYVQQLI